MWRISVVLATHRLGPSSQGSEGLCDPRVAASSVAGRWWLGPHCIVFRSCLGKAHSARDSFGAGGLRSGCGQAWLHLGPRGEPHAALGGPGVPRPPISAFTFSWCSPCACLSVSSLPLSVRTSDILDSGHLGGCIVT